MKVHMLTVTDAGIVHKSAHSSHEKAFAFLAVFCRNSWSEQSHDEPLSDDDELAVAHYFDFWDAEMTWDIDELEIDPAH